MSSEWRSYVCFSEHQLAANGSLHQVSREHGLDGDGEVGGKYGTEVGSKKWTREAAEMAEVVRRSPYQALRRRSGVVPGPGASDEQTDRGSKSLSPSNGPVSLDERSNSTRAKLRCMDRRAWDNWRPRKATSLSWLVGLASRG